MTWLSIVPSREVEAARDRVAVTVPDPSATLMALPSACVIDSDGIVAVPVPPIPGGDAAGALSTMMQPTAPAAAAACTLARNEHVPRSISAILPVTWAMFVI